MKYSAQAVEALLNWAKAEGFTRIEAGWFPGYKRAMWYFWRDDEIKATMPMIETIL